jgi:hypothetical protein
MYSNEVRRTVKDGLHMASLGSADLEARLGIKNPLHRKAGVILTQYLSAIDTVHEKHGGQSLRRHVVDVYWHQKRPF